jgi:2-dehydropantoate 2-reductase
MIPSNLQAFILSFSPPHQMAETIHVLGLGSVGILVAHALAEVPDRPPLNLLLHRPKEYRSRLLAVSRDGATDYQSDFTLEEFRDGRWYQEASRSSVQPTKHTPTQRMPPNETPIHLLIVAVKAHHTIDSIRLLKHRIFNFSTILFLQNGLGVLDELDAALFPDPSERPYYMSAVVTHCVHREGFLSAVHTVTGGITLGTSPRITRDSEVPLSLRPPPGAEKLVSILNRTRILNISFSSPQELLRQQLTKLAANSVYNPLTSLLGCSVNGLITSNDPRVHAISNALVDEFSSIIKALPLSELAGKEKLETDFSPANLKTTIYQIGLRAGEHTTSMLQDIRIGVKTEIMYLNGYFMLWASNLGIECPVNDTVTRMVLEKEHRATGK